MSAGPTRYWRETPEFQTSREAIAPSTKRFDEFFRGFELALLTDPEQVSWPVAGTHDVRVMSTDVFWDHLDIPELWLYFRLIDQEDCVELLYIEKAPSVEAPEGSEG